MYKTIQAGYIVAFGKLETEPVTDEYNNLVEIFKNKPIAPEGYDYRLKDVEYSWEIFKLPEPSPDPEPEPSADVEQKAEAYDYLTGRTSE